ncbi:class I SAM-dependent methyltransferase [Seonamhaeicola sp. ML3]|uniref:class I SAM-dependent methyltransferase n=1 Tax=Seonamhaeicola sp. ML3 TaxID=2937786 RepID=UPI00200F4081|nr:class I SAM-dependent methyltransferase [Seonamhaeicola sp. ML3]
MRIITLDDFIDTYAKLKQRGLGFISSKFKISKIKRAKTAFNHKDINSSNWWIIPEIRKRWNKMVTGKENIDFVNFVMANHLKDQSNLRMLSLGSGNCATELQFASFNNFQEIICCDISDILLKNAEKEAHANQFNNIKFIIQDANTYVFDDNYFDIVYFRASLHHFKQVDQLIGKRVKNGLKDNGLLIIDEYVGPNRIQFPKHQIKAINKALNIIPKRYRRRFMLNAHKNRVFGSGIIRMKIADPSECIESERIIPVIHKNFEKVFEAPYGGNILMTTLKDISHHFIELDTEKEKVLKSLFELEDDYLVTNDSDFIFGIYQK